MEKNNVKNEQVKDEVVELDTNKGTVRVGSWFFALCTGIGVAGFGIGITGGVIAGFTLVPVATTVFGLTAALVNGGFYKQTKDEENARFGYGDLEEVPVEEKPHQKVK